MKRRAQATATLCMLIDHLAYANRLRRIHPAEKVTGALFMLLCGLCASSVWWPLMVALGASLYVVWGARIPWRTWARLCVLPLGFLLTAGLGVAVQFTPGDGTGSGLLGGYSLAVTTEGLHMALRATCRALGSFTSLLALAVTTPMTDMAHFFRLLKLPPLLVDLWWLTYRSIGILLDTSSHMRQAQTARLGYATWRGRFRSLGILGAGLFVRSLLRADQAWQATLSRGGDQELLVLPPDYAFSKRRLLGITLGGVMLLSAALLLPGVRR